MAFQNRNYFGYERADARHLRATNKRKLLLIINKRIHEPDWHGGCGNGNATHIAGWLDFSRHTLCNFTKTVRSATCHRR